MEMLVAGNNDLSDSVSGVGFGVAGLLDPQKILGQTEATTTPGFGYTPSASEQAFVLLPNTPLNLEFRSRPGIVSLNVNSGDSGDFAHVWWSTIIGGEKLTLEYVLDRNLYVQNIRPSDEAVRLLARMNVEGMISSPDNEKLFSELMTHIKYWNGQEWVYKSSKNVAGSHP